MYWTPSRCCAPIMSAPCVQSAVAEPCQLSPPSRSSACGREARVASGFAEALRRRLEIQMREGVRRGAAGCDAVVLEQRFAHQMRRAAVAEVDARLAEVQRQ